MLLLLDQRADIVVPTLRLHQRSVVVRTALALATALIWNAGVRSEQTSSSLALDNSSSLPHS
jgi:hypothetical protein